MANPTTNFGWVMPTSTDLVTDLPADFNVFGQGVDTSMADLLGGTTGQILSKASATDMDFTWITNDIGDITAVNTTAPLAGGATSGAVTLSVTTATTSATGVVQLSDSTSTTSSVLAATPTAVKAAYDLANAAIPKTLTTTTGDTIYASAANTPARLGIGSTGQILTVASGLPTWATPAGGGKVLQVVMGTTTTETSSTTATFVDTTLTATITPTLNTSKILVIATQNGVAKFTASTGEGLKLLRGSTTISTFAVLSQQNGGTNYSESSGAIAYLDAPATTSATTYKTQMNNFSAVGTCRTQNNNAMSSIILMEIGA